MRLSISFPRIDQRQSPGGFTLLELIVSMAIISLILGLAVFSLGDLFYQQDFEKPGAELKQMARQAAGLASTCSRRYVIRLSESGAALFSGQTADPIEEIRFPSGVKFSIQPWGGTRWLKPGEYDWDFEASGLCEPILVRFEEGESVYEIDFHPLGGGVRDERMMIANQSP